MASKALLSVAIVMSLAGCQQEIVKAGVPPPAANNNDAAAGRKNDTVPKAPSTRGGLDLPKQLPKGPY